MGSVRLVNESNGEVPAIEEALFSCVEKALGKTLQPVTIIFVSKTKSRNLNLQLRGKDKDANVLSFTEDREIVVAPDVVFDEARKSGITEKTWMTRLIVHGILHLEGFDHDSQESARTMETLEDDIMSHIVRASMK